MLDGLKYIDKSIGILRVSIRLCKDNLTHLTFSYALMTLYFSFERLIHTSSVRRLIFWEEVSHTLG